MKEVKSPRKPLIYYYGIVLLVILIFQHGHLSVACKCQSERG